MGTDTLVAGLTKITVVTEYLISVGKVIFNYLTMDEVAAPPTSFSLFISVVVLVVYAKEFFFWFRTASTMASIMVKNFTLYCLPSIS